MKYVKSFAALLPLAVFLASSAAFAIKVTTGPDFDLNINFLLQARAQGDWDGVPPPAISTAPDGASPSGKFYTDFYVKRARFVGRGTAFKYFLFLITLDTPNFGVRGNYTTSSTFIQDLVIGVEPTKDLFIEAGFLLVPLAHGTVSNPGAQSAIDAPGTGLSRLFNNAARASRETGVQIRTLLFDHRILFRGGIYEGARSSQGPPAPAAPPPTDPVINPNGVPLLAGMVRLNLIGDEITYPGYPGIYLDGKSRVSVGVGGQWQSKGAVGGLVSGATAYPDYVVLAADAFIDLALAGDTEAVFGLNGYRFDYGSGNARTGFGASGEVGYRIGKIEPQVNVYWFNSDSKQNSSVRWAAGVNYFFKVHAAKIGAEFAGQIVNANLDTTPTLHQIIVQGQLFF